MICSNKKNIFVVITITIINDANNLTSKLIFNLKIKESIYL